MSITSDEVNLLIYRYLLESGFVHTAFSFAHESAVLKSEVAKVDVPQGALVLHLQKGLQYVEIDTHLTDANKEVACTQPFSLVSKHTCDVSKKKKADAQSKIEQISTSDVTHFDGHTGEVLVGQFNPRYPELLATGGTDATARIWTIPPGKAGSTAAAPAIVLQHTGTLRYQVDTRDVTTMAWSPDGEVLATGCVDGWVRLWSRTGTLMKLCEGHSGPIFSLKYNPCGSHFVTGSFDNSSIVWDARQGIVQQQWRLHSASALDCSWRNDRQFASSSGDKSIFVCEVGVPTAVRHFAGHTDEVNAVRFSHDGQFLASCSDDCSARIWTLNSEQPLHVLSGHQKPVYTLDWAPNSVQLATASYDKSVRLWDPGAGTCLSVLTGHTEAIYAIAFSPLGDMISSGSCAGLVNVYSTSDGELLQTFDGSFNGVFDVQWNKTLNKVAVCYAKQKVIVFDGLQRN